MTKSEMESEELRKMNSIWIRSSVLLILSLLIFIGSSSCGTKNTEALIVGNPEKITHSLWDSLLKKHVDPTGKVNYQGIIEDSLRFNQYIDQLSESGPGKDWSRDQQLAYWINAYNAFTVQLIIRNYPIGSIKEIGPKLAIPFVNSVWDIKFFEIGGEKMDLTTIEHKILRRIYNDPRVHFAIVCASFSCPRLLNEAYVAEHLETQLDDQAKDFINDKRKNSLDAANPKLSKIFNWYTGDFKDDLSLIEYINQYATVQMNEDADIEWLDYDWKLNE